jgi:hypothetical protein
VPFSVAYAASLQGTKQQQATHFTDATKTFMQLVEFVSFFLKTKSVAEELREA